MSVACGGPPQSAAVSNAPPAVAERPSAHPTSAPADGSRRVVFLGDSLTAGLGLPSAQAYPALIAQRLAGRGWAVSNAGVSGDTSAGALRRVEWSLDGGAAVLVVALGGNDALRGLPTGDLERNLDAIVTTAIDRGAVVVLAGMEAPPNNGAEYTDRFRQVYKDVAARHGVALVPFLLDGVAGVESLNQADGIHPNQAGAERVADTVWRALDPVVREIERSRSE